MAKNDNGSIEDREHVAYDLFFAKTCDAGCATPAAHNAEQAFVEADAWLAELDKQREED